MRALLVALLLSVCLPAWAQAERLLLGSIANTLNPQILRVN